MGLASFVKLFTPKDRVFYGLFEDVANVLSEMAVIFTAAIDEQDQDKRNALLKTLEDLEHKNDETTHKIFIELGRNFITPFDREDIHALATSLDDIADFIWASAKRITNYSIHDGDEITKGFANVITRSIQALNKAVRELRNMKDLRSITESCVLINSLENEADDIFDMSIERLFAIEPDAKEVIKKREIYQVMETATDKCEDAANVIESIIVKYA